MASSVTRAHVRSGARRPLSWSRRRPAPLAPLRRPLRQPVLQRGQLHQRVARATPPVAGRGGEEERRPRPAPGGCRQTTHRRPPPPSRGGRPAAPARAHCPFPRERRSRHGARLRVRVRGQDDVAGHPSPRPPWPAGRCTCGPRGAWRRNTSRGVARLDLELEPTVGVRGGGRHRRPAPMSPTRWSATTTSGSGSPVGSDRHALDLLSVNRPRPRAAGPAAARHGTQWVDGSWSEPAEVLGVKPAQVLLQVFRGELLRRLRAPAPPCRRPRSPTPRRSRWTCAPAGRPW
jgi:hypothetical protein